MEFEIRSRAEVEANEGKLVGYAAVFNSRSHDLGGFVEVIQPGAFDRTLKERPDVLALVDHDESKVLARTTNGTLKLTPDERGLRVEIDPADTSYARDSLTLVRRGDVHSMSFRFRKFPGGDSFDMGQTPPVRFLRSVELSEVSVVTLPAYPATQVSVRALRDATDAAVKQELQRLRLELAEHNF
jgi:HK97 family phage prohead protease